MDFTERHDYSYVWGPNHLGKRGGSKDNVMWVFRAIVAVSLAAVGVAQAAAAQGIEQLYEAAKKEGALVLLAVGRSRSTNPGRANSSSAFPHQGDRESRLKQCVG